MVFNNVFNSSCDNVEIVTAFLGVLELGRMKQVDIEQKYLFSDINVIKKNDCDINIDTTTLNYYNQNANSFASNTRFVDFRATQDKFLGKLPPAATILDFGCRSGHDTKYFLEQGYQVDAIDGSEELCRLASEYMGSETVLTPLY